MPFCSDWAARRYDELRMIGTDDDPEAGDRLYFEAIEEVFIRLRKAPLLLSPAN